MLKKLLTVRIDAETEEVWEKSLKDIDDIIKMMNNISRSAKIIKIEDVEE